MDFLFSKINNSFANKPDYFCIPKILSLKNHFAMADPVLGMVSGTQTYALKSGNLFFIL